MRAIYPGTFDPVTFGHLDLIERGLKVFGELIVAVAVNAPKKPLFPIRERLAMLRESTAGIEGNLVVESFDILLIDYARRRKAGAILRGLRAVSDFEYELGIALTNRKLEPEIETVFMMPSKKYIYLSSSIVREIAAYGGPLEEFVPPAALKHLKKWFRAGARPRKPAG